MKTKSNITAYIIRGIAAAMLLLTAQISRAGSATWLLSPQDSAWENANNWTLGGPPNGPFDVATFAQSSQTGVSISTPEEVNSIVFTSDSASFGFYISGCNAVSCGSQLVISGTGVTNNGSVLQRFRTVNGGGIVFNNASTAASAHMSVVNQGGDPYTPQDAGYTAFNDTSSAAGASISNFGGVDTSEGSATSFNDRSTAGHATIDNYGGSLAAAGGGRTFFNDSSTADSAILIAHDGDYRGAPAAIIFNGASTGGTAQVKVFGDRNPWLASTGYLDISGHQSGLTIGSIEGSGNVRLGANNLRVGTNGLNTSFSGIISGTGSLVKVGSGVLTLQANDCIADSVGLILVSGSIIKLDFTGPPDVIASLKVNGVPQPPGIYGAPMSGAPNILPEFTGSGTVSVGPVSTVRNISTRAFVQTGDNVLIGGFVVQGTEPKRVIIRAIGPELTRYGVPSVLVNPTLELHEATGALIASNDNWHDTIIGGVIRSDQRSDIRNSGYAPGDGRESAIIADLPAGNYTAIVRGVNNSTGVALVEVYDLSPETNSILGNIRYSKFCADG